MPEVARGLFALPPEDFVAARDRLAAELKDAGKTDEAAEVKKLRRPSIVAWAVNAASREGPEEVAALREAGQELRRAQRKTLSGGGGEDLRAATDARRALIQTLADAGVRAIGARGGAHRDAIAATFDAASVDDELGERLRTATLEREARPTAGFGAIEGFEVLQGGGGDDEEGAVEEDPAGARRERAREARAAAQRAAAAERAAEKARSRAEDLKGKAAAAVTAAREADADAKRLADEARTERKRADRSAKAAETDA
ncbi:MAG TPA: hypothetical protein VNP90_07905 [Actinomycetota bacterium]|nr:hypothetical protein [Actinomycetota bacterium]